MCHEHFQYLHFSGLKEALTTLKPGTKYPSLASISSMLLMDTLWLSTTSSQQSFSFTTLCTQIQAGSGNCRSTSDHGLTTESFRSLDISKVSLWVKWVGHRHHTWRWIITLRTVLLLLLRYHLANGKNNPKGPEQLIRPPVNSDSFFGTNRGYTVIPCYTPKITLPAHPYPAPKTRQNPSKPGAWNIRLHLEFWHCDDLNVPSHKLRFLSSLRYQSFINLQAWREVLVQMSFDVFFGDIYDQALY